LKNIITNILRGGTLISTYGLIISVLIQIFARFLLPSAPSWTEEASRLFFIYAVAFGVGLAYANQDFIAIDWIYNKFSRRVQKGLSIIIALVSFLLFAIMVFYSVAFAMQGYDEFSPGMKFRMSFAFMSMIILSTSLCYFILLEFISENKTIEE